ncbi:hypothetical protein PUN28_009775 [Cardiocondyla obscurior]|uniref:C2H2-type domain-containing protein n=1 Tax=Cardiocondyla obscurior TaxID=286306 RepID=A0AAW2FNR3_9HYME
MPNCALCKTTFPFIRSLFAHLTITHSNLSVYKCGENKCFRKFLFKNSFRKHLQQFHNFSLKCTEREEKIIERQTIRKNIKLLVEESSSNNNTVNNTNVNDTEIDDKHLTLLKQKVINIVESHNCAQNDIQELKTIDKSGIQNFTQGLLRAKKKKKYLEKDIVFLFFFCIF